jgi:site-specific recombinase
MDSDTINIMTKSAAATKADIDNILKAIGSLDQKTASRIDELDQKTASRIDDVLGVLDVMMTSIDGRFNKIESEQAKMQAVTHNILNQLDSIEKRLEISEDERLAMAHQLTRLHAWVERAAERIDVKFVH